MNDIHASNTVVLIGGPEAGKSNFLFRLWTGIDSGNGLLRARGLPRDAEYLQTGAETQLSGKFAGHTSHDVHSMSEIPVFLQGDPSRVAQLVVPDFDGEQINRIYRQRRWQPDWERLITPLASYLLFIRANSGQTVPALDWILSHALYGGPIPPPQGAPDQSGGDHSAERAAQVRTPTQVVLVDWLQFIQQAVGEIVSPSARPRFGIIVTAWDSVPLELRNGLPSDWVAENLPLLHQFISTNPQAFDFEFFGTSVFSGDPTTDEDFAATLKNGDPRTFGYVRHTLNGKPADVNDFTLPAAWALGWYPES